MRLNLGESGRQRLLDCYEDLRGGTLSKGGNPQQELALFLREGMTAWMSAWIGWMEVEPRQEQGSSRPSQSGTSLPTEHPMLPGGRSPEIIRLLTTLVLSRLEEPCNEPKMDFKR